MTTHEQVAVADLQIERVETYPLLHRLSQAYGDANGYKRYRTSYLIRIITRAGIDGWGEIIDWLPTLHKGFCERIIPYLLGKQVDNRVAIVDVIGKWHQRSASGVSMALTEILAKAAGLSVCQLWGGQILSGIPVYASLQSYRESEDWMQQSWKQVSQQVDDGFKMVKVKIGGRSVREDQTHIEKLMNLLPKEVQVAVDANQSYDCATARKWEGLFSRYDNWLWLEEPMPMDRTNEYVKLRSSLSIPLAGGENLIRCAQFLPLYEEGAIDIAQPDLMHTGGIDDYRTHLQMARQFGYRVSPHSFDGSLARLYTLFAQACLLAWTKMDSHPIEPVEWDVMENLFTQLFPLRPLNGEVTLPAGVGIGVEPDWEIMNALRWDGSAYA
ncbi:mandelate racemase/muconate lactonizing enzyme family protein [Brevibacillus antibioticus]|uniref:Mandelate racemase/muconate lactonizing enzyme family protein n=1 Tax=Brevibacillus antibioticus TaxID=2570228 RepID=A0A4U2Y2Q4_9BACL|nr:mandelate racemase/muconate lactonizing enzyme family protein [Brevibacillus antibioticus]TKI54709.1 mandelate racemase/muconate lactonizing enzyme family protein [Brevibacillus antibioticus]